jgi:hypothetical protein
MGTPIKPLQDKVAYLLDAWETDAVLDEIANHLADDARMRTERENKFRDLYVAAALREIAWKLR